MVPMPGDGDAFLGFATEFADGERWKLLQSEGWDDFQVRLAEVVGELPVRRRQALMMLLLAMVDQTVDSAQVREFLDAHDASTEEGVEAVIAWLRQKRRERG